jgi:hypothetical protein
MVQAAAIVSEDCDYRGDWRLGIAVTNLRGVVTSVVLSDFPFEIRARPYPEYSYRSETSASSFEIRSSPMTVVERLTDKLNRVLNERRYRLG